MRGFNRRFSNKLLVLMDGRSIYSPLFSGVLWEDNDPLRMMLGVRFEDNSFTGSEPLPNARLIWTPTASQSLWASVSRTVRTPSRAELDAQLDYSVLPAGAPGNPTPLPILMRNVPGEHSLDNETVIAYEIGYRQQFGTSLSADVAVVYNQYDDLRAVTPSSQQLAFVPSPYLIQNITPDNSLKAHTQGIERLAATTRRPLPACCRRRRSKSSAACTPRQSGSSDTLRP